MRINHTKRIYMTEADGSPGGGAAPAAPAEPPAAPAAPEPIPAVSLDQVKGLISEQLGGFKNGFFAELRKAGVLKKDETPPPPPAPKGDAPAALSLSDVESMLERERVITRVATEHKLTDAQVKRMKTMIAAEKPDDVSGWVSTFVTDMGLVRPTEQPAPTNPVTPVPQPQPNGHPISDKGSPAPGGVVNWEREFAENPLGMSPAARSAMDAKHGRDKAVKMRVDAAQAQAARIKVTTTQQG